MTLDVLLKHIDEAFLDEIDEIMEDSMIQLFIAHVDTLEELHTYQAYASAHASLFYSAPYELRENIDENCLAYTINDVDDLSINIDKPIFIDASLLSDPIIDTLLTCKLSGIILNAKQTYEKLPTFLMALDADTIEAYDKSSLEKSSMHQLVFGSSYPAHDFDSITDVVKVVSDTLFRPEGSIIANATTSALKLFGLKK